MKRIIKPFTIVLLYITLLNACTDDFLSKKNLSEMTPDNLNPTMALTACYDGLQSRYIYNDNPWACGFFNMDCMTDNGGHFNWTGWMCGYDITNGIQTPTSWMINSYWQETYEVIKRCNLLIDIIDDEVGDLDEDTKELYKAEATAIRALMYLNLTMTYQHVPYITQSITSLKDIHVPKTNRADIITQEIARLQQVIKSDILPVTPKNFGRMSKGAALGILGRMALYNEKWDIAIDAYREIMTLGYILDPDYEKLFSKEGETSGEIIFSVRFEGPGKSEGSLFANHWNAPLESMNGSLDLVNAFYKTDGKPYEKPYEDLFDADGNPDSIRYQNRDPRLKATLFVSGMKWGMSPAIFYGGSSPSRSTVYIFKYFDPYTNADPEYGQNGQDAYVIRYAEVLISLAEALVMKGGYDYKEVTDLVNMIRQRVNMPTVAQVEEIDNGGHLSTADLLDVIKHERRVETAFEGLRLFDLYRWKELGKAVATINSERELNNTYSEFFDYEYRTFLMPEDKNYIWPLPQNDIDTNSELEQHDLWK